MRNKIKLYIEGVRADLDDGAFILLNYTQEDLTNPTIVKNSFSKQITLPGTPTNDAIFGHIYRNDRDTLYGSPYNGPYFDPCRKTSFVLYNETNEIVESGYLKLDSIEQTRRKRSYKVTLFGGLGSFLYGISYKANGDKMTLADLDFGEVLDFTINRTAVSDAWARINGDTTKDAKWDIINFVPSYGGLPPSPFDANKCIVNALLTGLKAKAGDYDRFTTVNGLTIVTLNEKVTGDACGDYRSYLQKPAIKISALINAICDPNNNGGWTVNKDAEFFSNTNEYWKDLWMTLPNVYELNIDQTSATNTQTLTSLDTLLPIVGGGGAGVYNLTINSVPVANMTGLPNYDYELWCYNAYGITQNLLVFTLRLYDSSQNEIASAVYTITTDGGGGASIPTADFTCDHISGTGEFVDGNGNQMSFPLSLEATGAAYYKLSMDCENYFMGFPSHNPGDMSWKMWQSGANVFTDNFVFDPIVGSWDVDIIGSSTSTVRTGASITQASLLGGGHTPADYLLSYCKMFGIQMVCHKDSKTIDLKLRKNFYSSTVVDIGGRIDRAKGVTKKPFAFDARWYEFGNEAKGEFADYYQNRYNRPFGQFRVNTGYEFDAQEKVMTTDIVFGNLCSLMEASPYFCDLVLNNCKIPSVFLSGGTYILFNGNETMSLDLPYLTNAVKTWWNPSYPMHDAIEKLQLHGPQDAHIDERDTLVFYTGEINTTSMDLYLTDDTEEMLYMNGNNPCWLPGWGHGWKLNKLPKFSRYIWSGTTINLTLDWGDPIEYQIPGSDLGVNSSVFATYWKKYIEDRYDDDSAVVTCYVDLRGFQVNEDFLCQFYAFDGAVWALNRIIDHSLTTSGTTKCEFVKVQDTTNYTTY